MWYAPPPQYLGIVLRFCGDEHHFFRFSIQFGAICMVLLDFIDPFFYIKNIGLYPI